MMRVRITPAQVRHWLDKHSPAYSGGLSNISDPFTLEFDSHGNLVDMEPLEWDAGLDKSMVLALIKDAQLGFFSDGVRRNPSKRSGDIHTSGFPSTGGVPLSPSRVYRVRVDLAHPIYNPDTGQKLDGKKVFWTGKTRPPRSGHPGSGWAEFVLADDQETRFFLRPNLVVPDESFGPSAQYRRNPQHSDAVPFASVKVGQRFYTAPGMKEAVLGGPRAWFEKVSETEAIHLRSRGRFTFKPTHQVVVEEVGSQIIGVPKQPQYDAQAVDAAIASSRRAGRGISRREAKAIHGLLKGRHHKNPPSADQDVVAVWSTSNPKGQVELRRGLFKTGLYSVVGPGFAGHSNAPTDETAIQDVEEMAASGFEGRVKGKVIRIQ